MKIWSLFRPASAPDKKSLAVPDAALMSILGANLSTGNGIPVSIMDALRVPVVSNCIQLISEAVASLDVHVTYRDGADEIEVTDHPVLSLLLGEANDWTSSFELIRAIMVDAMVSDQGGMAWVNRVNGRPQEIISYRQGTLTFETDLDTGERKYSLGNRRIAGRDVIHLMPPLQHSPLTLARDAIGIAVALDRHAARLFTRGAKPGGALKFPKGMAEDAVKKIRESWRATHESEDSSGRTVILYDGAEFEAITLNSTDAQFLENRKFQVAEIARAFNVPGPMIGDLSQATWSNSEQKGREFLSYTLEPWLRGLESALNRALFTDDERGRYRVRFDRDDLTRADLATRATVINSLIASQTLNPNEGRSWLGLPPREGGDAFLNPNISAAPAVRPQIEDEPKETPK